MKHHWVGTFIVRRPTGWLHRWEYATGRHRLEKLGLGGATQTSVWTCHRSKARRWATRRDAARWLRREGPWQPDAEVIRVGTAAFGPLADLPEPRPCLRQLTLF